MRLGHSECAQNEREATLIRSYGALPENEQIIIYKGIRSFGSSLFNLHGERGEEHGKYKYLICLSPGQLYTVEYKGVTSPWDNESNVRILLGEVPIYQGSLGEGTLGFDTFQVEECTAPDTLVTLSKQYSADASNDFFSLFIHNATSSSYILLGRGTKAYNNRMFSYSFCFGPNKQYGIRMESINGNGWTGNSFVQIMNGNTMVYKGTFSNGYKGVDYFSDHPPCAPSDISAILTRRYSCLAAEEELLLLYKGDLEPSSLVFHTQGLDYSNYITASYSICIEPEQQYTVSFMDSGKNGWYIDATYGYSYVSIADGANLIYSSHLHSGESRVETFVYHPKCSSNEIQATVSRKFGHYPLTEPFRIFKGNFSEGISVMSVYGTASDEDTEGTFSLCIEKGQEYSIIYYSSRSDGWTPKGLYESTVTITYGNQILSSGIPVKIENVEFGTFVYPDTCQPNQIRTTLLRQYNDNAQRELFQIFKGKTSNDLYLFGIYGIKSHSNRRMEYVFCADQDQPYFIFYRATTDHGWGSDSLVEVQYLNNTIYRGSLIKREYNSEVFTVSLPSCAADDVWNETIIGHRATLPCKSSEYEGQLERFCGVDNSTAQWGPIIDECTLKAPVISYPQSVYIIKKNDMIEPIVPTTQNRITLFDIDPVLPDGLSFNTTIGSISGTPTLYSPPTKYMITASNEETSTSAVINIMVSDKFCYADGVWPETLAGQVIALPCEQPELYTGNYTRACIDDSNAHWSEVTNNCVHYQCPSETVDGVVYPATDTNTTITVSCPSIYQTGSVTRTCPLSTTPTWGSIVNTCRYTEPSLSYDSIVNVYHYNEPITPLIPTCVGECTSYSISPSLPSGLTINTSMGIISGTPLEMKAQTDFTVTVSNRDASSTFTIRIRVIDRVCEESGPWNATIPGNKTYVFCKDNNAAQYRECLLEKNRIHWGEIHDEMCTMSTLPNIPQVAHAFIRFYIPYSEKSPDDYTAQSMYALYKSLYDYFGKNEMDIDGIFILLDSISVLGNQKTSTVMRFTVGVRDSDLAYIKNGLIGYLKTGFYMDVIEKDPSFGTSPFEIKEDDIKEVKCILYAVLYTLAMFFVSISTAFFILLIISFLAIDCMQKRKPKNENVQV